eukprot:gene1965-2292_t
MSTASKENGNAMTIATSAKRSLDMEDVLAPMKKLRVLQLNASENRILSPSTAVLPACGLSSGLLNNETNDGKLLHKKRSRISDHEDHQAHLLCKVHSKKGKGADGLSSSSLSPRSAAAAIETHLTCRVHDDKDAVKKSSSRDQSLQHSNRRSWEQQEPQQLSDTIDLAVHSPIPDDSSGEDGAGEELIQLNLIPDKEWQRLFAVLTISNQPQRQQAAG